MANTFVQLEVSSPEFRSGEEVRKWIRDLPFPGVHLVEEFEPVPMADGKGGNSSQPSTFVVQVFIESEGVEDLLKEQQEVGEIWRASDRDAEPF